MSNSISQYCVRLLINLIFCQSFGYPGSDGDSGGDEGGGCGVCRHEEPVLQGNRLQDENCEEVQRDQFERVC